MSLEEEEECGAVKWISVPPRGRHSSSRYSALRSPFVDTVPISTQARFPRFPLKFPESPLIPFATNMNESWSSYMGEIIYAMINAVPYSCFSFVPRAAATAAMT